MFTDPVAHLEILVKHSFEVEWNGLCETETDELSIKQYTRGLLPSNI
jgi:hypothetical protein